MLWQIEVAAAFTLGFLSRHQISEPTPCGHPSPHTDTDRPPLGTFARSKPHNVTLPLSEYSLFHCGKTFGEIFTLSSPDHISWIHCHNDIFESVTLGAREDCEN